VGMIVEDADVALSEAKTSLIQAQAAVYTTKLTVIAGTASESRAKSESAEAIAQARLDESFFRREAMIVVVALIVLIIAALLLVRRRVEGGWQRDGGGDAEAAGEP